MSKVPSDVSYTRLISALQRDDWVVVRQRGSHIQLLKQTEDETRRVTVPAQRPMKRRMLARILKQVGLTIDQFLELLN